METNEQLKMTLVREAEAEMVQLLTRVQGLKTGDLKGVEHEVLTSMFAIGRTTLEQIMQAQPETVEAPARREGACGHQQRLVGMRPKQVLTLLGAITTQRAYYQCLIPPGEQRQEGKPTCTHGEAPADTLWGIGERRTSAGVQQQVSYLCASLTLEEAAATKRPALPAPDVGAAGAVSDAASGRGAGCGGASTGGGFMGGGRREAHHAE